MREALEFIRSYPKWAKRSLLLLASVLAGLLITTFPDTPTLPPSETNTQKEESLFRTFLRYPIWVAIPSIAISGSCIGILVLSNNNSSQDNSHINKTDPVCILEDPFSDEINTAIINGKKITVISNWRPEWINLSSFEDALNAGASLQLVFINPDSPYLEQRSLDLGNDKKYGKRRLQEDLRRIRNELCRKVSRDTIHQKLSIHIHDSLPSGLIVQCDDQYYLGMYFHGKSVSDNFIIKVPKESALAKALSQDISYLISEANSLNLYTHPSLALAQA